MGAVVASHTIAVLGAGPYQPIWNSTVHLFPTDTTIFTNLYGYDAALKAGGANQSGSVILHGSAACSGIVAPLKGYALQLGLQWEYSGGISSTAPNYTAECLAAKEAGVNGIALAVGYQVAPRLAADCAQQGYHPLWIFPQSDPSLLKAPSLNGAYGFDLSLPYFLNVPQLKNFHTAMAKLRAWEDLPERGPAGRGAPIRCWRRPSRPQQLRVTRLRRMP